MVIGSSFFFLASLSHALIAVKPIDSSTLLFFVSWQIKLLQGFSASLNSDGVLEVRGAMPTDSSSPSASQSPLPTSIATASCITSPPLPPRRPPPLASHLRRRDFPPLSNSQASMAEENAKLRLMVMCILLNTLLSCFHGVSSKDSLHYFSTYRLSSP
ncbi:unnamed protein product [Taenia asiatica]|uniref:Secreted protein n=1 Tax=Taenia asiatica TaxID=60517 RepID=A0A0R3VYD9_TAEAS|nr:unnamed protein product [Taenia asiatica]